MDGSDLRRLTMQRFNSSRFPFISPSLTVIRSARSPNSTPILWRLPLPSWTNCEGEEWAVVQVLFCRAKHPWAENLRTACEDPYRPGHMVFAEIDHKTVGRKAAITTLRGHYFNLAANTPRGAGQLGGRYGPSSTRAHTKPTGLSGTKRYGPDNGRTTSFRLLSSGSRRFVPAKR